MAAAVTGAWSPVSPTEDSLFGAGIESPGSVAAGAGSTRLHQGGAPRQSHVTSGPHFEQSHVPSGPHSEHGPAVNGDTPIDGGADEVEWSPPSSRLAPHVGEGIGAGDAGGASTGTGTDMGMGGMGEDLDVQLELELEHGL